MKSISCLNRVAEARLCALVPLILTGLLLVPVVHAGSPAVSTTDPRGGQRGTEVEVTIRGSRLADAEAIVFHQPGITWKNLEVDPKRNGRDFKVTFAIAPDATLGEHVFRVRTRSGTSYARRFWVSQFPNVQEKDGNNSFESPQDIPLNVTIEGRMQRETVDYFRVKAKKGQRLSVEVEGIRNVASRNFSLDPYVAIMNQDRFEIASSDDTALLRQDCYVSTIVPEDGDYVVMVRDSAYQGQGQYRAHVGTFPRPSAVYPAGGPVGGEFEVTLLGDPKGEFRQKVKLPGEAKDYPFFATQGSQSPPSGNWMRVSNYPNVLETEENNDSWQSVEKSAGTLPLAFNGILQEEGDFDYFRFTAKKGQRFEFQAVARGVNSPVDPVMHVFDSKGKVLGGNDDSGGSADAKYDFNAPADGDYFVRVYDHLRRGGPDFVYRIETAAREPELIVSMPEFSRDDNQFRKTMDVPRGGRFAAVVNVTRRNLRAEVDLIAKGLPEGVVMKVDRYPSNVTQFPIVFEAAPDAPLGARLAELWAESVEENRTVRGRYTQELDWIRGNPNRTLYYSTESDALPVTVCEPAPFTIDLVPPAKPLMRDGKVSMKVVAKRQAGFTKPITVRWLWRPPGVSCNSTATIPEGKNEAVFNLTCNSRAELRTWKVCVLAEGNDGSGLVYSASDLVDLTIEEPFTTMEMQLGTVIQGQSGELVVDVTEVRPFKGEAKVRLVGTPAKTETQELTLKPGQKQLRFPIVTQPGAPVGQHKNLFCELTFNDGGVSRVQRAGMGGILRIDPKPKEPAKPKTAVAKNQPKKPAEKPLSRLEQLRLQAKQEAAANP